MFAQDLDAATFAHKGHQGIAGQKSLGVMDQVDLMTVHRVRAGHQLEIPKMRGQHHDPVAGIALLDLIPIVETLVADAVAQPEMEKSGQTDVFRAAPTEVDIGVRRMRRRSRSLRSGNAIDRFFSPISRGGGQQVAEEPSDGAQRVQYEIRQQAQHMQAPRISWYRANPCG